MIVRGTDNGAARYHLSDTPCRGQTQSVLNDIIRGDTTLADEERGGFR
jgi:hypothetical protein